MADPILPGGIRVQAILQGNSALPEDRYVTTWAFASDAAETNAGKAAAIAKVRAFYTVVRAPGPNKVCDYLAGAMINEALSEFRAYSLADPPQERVPYIESWGSTLLSNAAPLPSEVAACVSYYCGLNRPGRRGRVYLGPLNTSAMTSNDSPAVLSPNAQTCFKQAGKAMIETAPLFPTWCLLTKSGVGSPQLVPITNGWVDNAFDTIRKRGEQATNRALYP